MVDVNKVLGIMNGQGSQAMSQLQSDYEKRRAERLAQMNQEQPEEAPVQQTDGAFSGVRQLGESIVDKTIDSIAPAIPPERRTKAERALKDAEYSAGRGFYQSFAPRGDEYVDPEGIKKAAGMVQAFKESYVQGDINIDKGRLLYKMSEGGATEADYEQLRKYEIEMRSSLERMAKDQYVATAAGQIAPFITESIEKGGKGYLLGYMVGAGLALVAGQAGPQAGVPEEVVTVPAFGHQLGKVVGSFASLENMRQIEQGHAWGELVASGVHPDLARWAARTYGGASVALEAVQLKLLRRLVPGGDQLVKNALGKAVKTVMKDRVARAGANVLKTSFGEATVEGSQELTQNVLVEMAKQLNDALEGTNLSEIEKKGFIDVAFEGVPEVFAQTMVGFGVTAIPGTTVNFVIDSRGKIKTEQKAKEDIIDEVERENFDKTQDKKKPKKPKEKKKPIEQVIAEHRKSKGITLFDEEESVTAEPESKPEKPKKPAAVKTKDLTSDDLAAMTEAELEQIPDAVRAEVILRDEGIETTPENIKKVTEKVKESRGDLAKNVSTAEETPMGLTVESAQQHLAKFIPGVEVGSVTEDGDIVITVPELEGNTLIINEEMTPKEIRSLIGDRKQEEVEAQPVKPNDIEKLVDMAGETEEETVQVEGYPKISYSDMNKLYFVKENGEEIEGPEHPAPKGRNRTTQENRKKISEAVRSFQKELGDELDSGVMIWKNKKGDQVPLIAILEKMGGLKGIEEKTAAEQERVYDYEEEETKSKEMTEDVEDAYAEKAARESTPEKEKNYKNKLTQWDKAMWGAAHSATASTAKVEAKDVHSALKLEYLKFLRADPENINKRFDFKNTAKKIKNEKLTPGTRHQSETKQIREFAGDDIESAINQAQAASDKDVAEVELDVLEAMAEEDFGVTIDFNDPMGSITKMEDKYNETAALSVDKALDEKTRAELKGDLSNMMKLLMFAKDRLTPDVTFDTAPLTKRIKELEAKKRLTKAEATELKEKKAKKAIIIQEALDQQEALRNMQKPELLGKVPSVAAADLKLKNAQGKGRYGTITPTIEEVEDTVPVDLGEGHIVQGKVRIPKQVGGLHMGHLGLEAERQGFRPVSQRGESRFQEANVGEPFPDYTGMRRTTVDEAIKRNAIALARKSRSEKQEIEQEATRSAMAQLQQSGMDPEMAQKVLRSYGYDMSEYDGPRKAPRNWKPKTQAEKRATKKAKDLQIPKIETVNINGEKVKVYRDAGIDQYFVVGDTAQENPLGRRKENALANLRKQRAELTKETPPVEPTEAEISTISPEPIPTPIENLQKKGPASTTITPALPEKSLAKGSGVNLSRGYSQPAANDMITTQFSERSGKQGSLIRIDKPTTELSLDEKIPPSIINMKAGTRTYDPSTLADGIYSTKVKHSGTDTSGTVYIRIEGGKVTGTTKFLRGKGDVKTVNEWLESSQQNAADEGPGPAPKAVPKPLPQLTETQTKLLNGERTMYPESDFYGGGLVLGPFKKGHVRSIKALEKKGIVRTFSIAPHEGTFAVMLEKHEGLPNDVNATADTNATMNRKNAEFEERTTKAEEQAAVKPMEERKKSVTPARVEEVKRESSKPAPKPKTVDKTERNLIETKKRVKDKQIEDPFQMLKDMADSPESEAVIEAAIKQEEAPTIKEVEVAPPVEETGLSEEESDFMKDQAISMLEDDLYSISERDEITGMRETPSEKLIANVIKRIQKGDRPEGVMDETRNAILMAYPSKKIGKPSERGSSPEITAAAKGLANLIKDSYTHLRAGIRTIGDKIDVEAPWRRKDALNSGIAFKNYFSETSKWEEEGRKEVANLHAMLNAAVGGEATTQDKADIVFLYEDKAYARKMAETDLDRYNMLKPIADEFGKFWTQAEDVLRSRGFDTNPVIRMQNEAYDRALTSESLGEQLEALNDLTDLMDTNYVHIPLTTYQKAALRDKIKGLKYVNEEESARKFLTELTQQRRTAKSLSNIISKNPDLLELVDPFDLMLKYQTKFGLDMAKLDIRDALLSDGLLSEKAKKPKGWIRLGREYGVLQNYNTDPATAQMIQHLYQANHGQSWAAKALSLAKMASFYNPIFLPAYDLYQASMSGLPFRHPVRFVRNFALGLKDVMTNTVEYRDAMSNGAFSKPFQNPFHEYVSEADLLDKTANIKNPVLRSARREISKMFNVGWSENKKSALLKLLVGKPLYQASWDIAWGLDESIRMATYRTFKQKGMRPETAGQLAARFHGDYASVPVKTRRAINKVLYTPTFKLAMGKLYKDMVTYSARGIYKKLRGKQLTNYEKAMMSGAAATTAVTLGFDMYMRSVGYEPDDESGHWLLNIGRKYVKKVKGDDGRPAEVVITWSNPGNLTQRYGERIGKALRDGPEKGGAGILYDTFKWDLHPAWQTAVNLKMNRDERGNLIWNVDDSFWKRSGDQAAYGIKRTIRVLEGLQDIFMDDPNDEAYKAGKAVAKSDFPLLAELTMQPYLSFVGAYERDPRKRRQMVRMKRMANEFKTRSRSFYKKYELKPNKEWMENFKERMEREQRYLESLEQ